MDDRGPHVVIAGAPRCGSTALFRWLCAHPGAWGAPEKEVRWFMDADSPLCRPDGGVTLLGLEPYLARFDGAPPGALRLEATPDYLYQHNALRDVPRLPALRSIVFVLRRPADRVFSMYRFASRNMARLEPGISFAQFVAMVRHSPGSLADRPLLAAAIEHGRYARWLAPWLQAAGRDRVQVVLFEELMRDPQGTMSRLSEAAGLSSRFWAGYGFPPANESYDVRSHWLQSQVRRWQARLPRNAVTRGMASAYRRFFTRPAPPPDGAERETLIALDALYDRDVEDLAGLTGLDLSAWRIARD